MPDELLSEALVVSLSRTRWTDVWRSRHQVMSRLARANDVLFVSRAQRPGKWTPLAATDPALPRLRAYQPPRWLPLMKSRPRLEAALDQVRRYLLRRQVRRRGARALVLYIWDPSFASYVDDFPDALVCFHLFDELTMYGQGVDSERADELETLMARADVVVVASQPLADRYQRGRPVHVCPNGVDLELFGSEALLSEGDPLVGLGRPRLVYSGSLRAQIDIELLDGIAAARPDWTLVLVGDVAAGVAALPATVSLLGRPNVAALGRRPQADVARVLAACDVALVPYRTDGAGSFCSPLKLPEYLAVGLPVVSTPIAGATIFGDGVRLAEGLDQWLAQIDAAMHERGPEQASRRRTLAGQFSWDSRVDDIRRWLWRGWQDRRATSSPAWRQESRVSE